MGAALGSMTAWLPSLHQEGSFSTTSPQKGQKSRLAPHPALADRSGTPPRPNHLWSRASAVTEQPSRLCWLAARRGVTIDKMSIFIPERELPQQLTPDAAVEAAYAAELAEVASKLQRGLPCLVECDKDLAPFL